MEWLRGLDKSLLLVINRDWTNPFFDWLLPAMTEFNHTFFFKFVFFPLLFVFLLWRYGKFGVAFFVGAGMTVGLCDFIGGRIIKPLVGRLRPDLSGIDVILRAPHYGGFSFMSNHSSNMFCVAAFMTAFFPKLGYVLYPYAAVIAYSRIYVGVHFPFDVFSGAIFGVLIGSLGARATKKVLKKYPKLQETSLG